MKIFELVLPLIGVLVGAALSPIFADRQERKRWHRQKQYEVARAVTTAARAVLWRSDEVGSTLKDGDLEKQKEAVRQAMLAFRENFADVKLLFNKPTIKAAENLEDQLGNRLYPHVDNLSTKAEHEAEEVVDARLRMTDFQDAARAEILEKFCLKRRLGALFASRK